MKSNELFDILGEIDDKFYREAELPDDDCGEAFVSERRPFREVMSLLLPAAACIMIAVAIVFGAKAINGRELAEPSVPDSSNAPSSGFSADYPPLDYESVPDIAGTADDTQSAHGERKLRAATLATLRCGEYEVSLLGEYIHVDRSADPDKLRIYDLKLALSKDGENVVSVVVTDRDDGGYALDRRRLPEYLEYYKMSGGDLILFKYLDRYGDSTALTTFYAIYNGSLIMMKGMQGAGAWDGTVPWGTGLYSVSLSSDYAVDAGKNVISCGSTVYSFNFDKNFFTVETLFGADTYLTYDGQKTASLANITLGTARYGGVGVHLIADELIFIADMPDLVCADTFTLIFEKDGVLIAQTFISGSGSEFDKNKLADNCVRLYEFDGKPLAMIALRFRGSKHSMTYFFTLEDDELVLVPFYNYVRGYGKTIHESFGEELAVDTDNGLLTDGDTTYRFVRDNGVLSLVCGEPDGNGGHAGVYDQSGYVDYSLTDENIQPAVIFDTKTVGEYTLRLRGDGVRNVFSDGRYLSTEYKRLLITVEKDGYIPVPLYADNYEPIDGRIIGEYLQPFELLDGMGFVMYYSLDPGSKFCHYAMLYSIKDGGSKDDMIEKLRYEHDYAPAPATGSPCYVGDKLAAVPSGNILNGDKCRVTIDFSENKFSLIYNGDSRFISEYAGYDSGLEAVQGHVLLDEKAVGGARIALVCESAENTSYAGAAAVKCLGCELVAADMNGEVVEQTFLGDVYLAPEELTGYVRPFELKGGAGFVFYQNVESWANSLPSCDIYVIGANGTMSDRLSMGSEYVASGFTADRERNALIDENGGLTINFADMTAQRNR